MSFVVECSPFKILPPNCFDHCFDPLSSDRTERRLIEIRKECKKNLTFQNISDYYQCWLIFVEKLEQNRNNIEMLKITTFSWYFPNNDTLYESRCLRFETIMISMLKVQSLINLFIQGECEKDELMIEAYKILFFKCRDQLKAWKTRNEFQLPFECTFEGIEFYCNLCLYLVQRKEITDYYPNFFNFETLGLIGEKRFEEFKNYGFRSIQLLGKMISILESYHFHKEMIKYAHGCLNKSLMKKLKEEFTIMSSITLLSHAKVIESKNYDMFQIYLSFIIDHYLINLKKSKLESILDKTTINGGNNASLSTLFGKNNETKKNLVILLDYEKVKSENYGKMYINSSTMKDQDRNEPLLLIEESKGNLNDKLNQFEKLNFY